MSLRERVDRLWPSIVALVGTVGVVVGLLYFFSDNSGDPSNDPASDQAGDEPTEGASPTGSVLPTENPTDEPTDEVTDDPTDEPTDEPTDDGPTTAPPELLDDVGVLNATSVGGLAGEALIRFEEGGWPVTGTGDYTSGDVTVTTIFYPSEESRASAEAFAAQFPEIAAVEPTPSGSNINTDHPVVILAQDYADAVESP